MWNRFDVTKDRWFGLFLAVWIWDAKPEDYRNLPKVFTRQRPGRESNRVSTIRWSDALPVSHQSHRAGRVYSIVLIFSYGLKKFPVTVIDLWTVNKKGLAMYHVCKAYNSFEVISGYSQLGNWCRNVQETVLHRCTSEVSWVRIVRLTWFLVLARYWRNEAETNALQIISNLT